MHLLLEDGSRYKVPRANCSSPKCPVDQTTGSVTLRALFPNPDKLLLPGMFVREQIEEGVGRMPLLVPQLAVTHNQKGEATALVVDADNKVELRTLVTERAIGDKWLVTAGLEGRRPRHRRRVAVRQAGRRPSSPRSSDDRRVQPALGRRHAGRARRPS